MMLGIVVIALTNKKLLPERQPADPPSLDTRDYQLAMRVRNDAPFVGKTVEAADLRHLPGVYLTRIETRGKRHLAPGPEETVLEGDLLWFTGVLDSVRDLRNIRGLEMLDGQARKVQGLIKSELWLKPWCHGIQNSMGNLCVTSDSGLDSTRPSLRCVEVAFRLKEKLGT